MKKSKFSDSQIMEALKRVEFGLGVFSGLPKQKAPGRRLFASYLAAQEGLYK